jgi:hypothetical protein
MIMPTENREKENHGLNEAKAQLSSIVDMVAALECDYDRLEELRNERLSYGSLPVNVERDEWDKEHGEELAELENAANENKNHDEAYEAIQEDPLSIEIRSGWNSVGDELSPEEFRILLCTGGPAVQIVGELDEYNQPSRARIEYCDWGTPWTELLLESCERDAVLTYCQQFYFGE